MTRIGLTGGVGSGKSTVASMFSQRGAFVVDADAVARDVVAPGSEGLAALVAEFGADILASDGSLDRPALADRAFADDGARARLNAITHPRIAARTAELMAQAAAGQVVVHDVPLLVELGLMPAYDLVVVVDAPDEVRLARLEERGMPEEEARRRMAAQCARVDRLAAADVVLDNSNELHTLEPQVERLWRELTKVG
jgi:dephospho-CoA kinase